MFVWMSKEHLCVLVYVVTVMHSMQAGYMDKAQKYTEKAFMQIEKLKCNLQIVCQNLADTNLFSHGLIYSDWQQEHTHIISHLVARTSNPMSIGDGPKRSSHSRSSNGRSIVHNRSTSFVSHSFCSVTHTPGTLCHEYELFRSCRSPTQCCTKSKYIYSKVYAAIFVIWLQNHGFHFD